MNTAQQEVLDKVIELLSEHFDHAVVAVGCYDEEKQYVTSATYSGGVAPALGLCKLYETKWHKEHLWGPDEEYKQPVEKERPVEIVRPRSNTET